MPVSKRRKPRPHRTPQKAGIAYHALMSDDEAEAAIMNAVAGDTHSEMEAVNAMACLSIPRLDYYSSHGIAPVEGAGWQGPYEAWFEPNDAALTDAFTTGYGRALYGLMHAPFLEMGKKYRQQHPVHHMDCWEASITNQYPSHAEGWLLRPEVMWALDTNKSGVRLQIEVAPDQGSFGRQARRYYPSVANVAAKMLCMMLLAVDEVLPGELQSMRKHVIKGPKTAHEVFFGEMLKSKDNPVIEP